MECTPISKPPNPPQPTDIPSDLYPLILQHLSNNDLTTCSRVCRAFYIEVLPLLYHDTSIDLGKRVNPGLVKRKESGEKLESSSLVLPPPSTSHLLRPTSSTYDYTIHLTLRLYSKHHCLEYAPLLMPNLDTLHLISREGDNDPRPWTCHSQQRHLGTCSADLGCFCPLLEQLKPRRIIIGGYAKVDDYDFCAPTDTWPPLPFDSSLWLKEVIIHATGYDMIQFEPGHEGGMARYGRRDTLPPKIKLEKLTFVLQSHKRWKYSQGVYQVESEPLVARWEPEKVWTRLAMALVGDVGMLEVVGMDGLDSDRSGMQKTYWDMEMAKKKMKKYLVDKGIQEQEAEKRVENVRFTRSWDYEKTKEEANPLFNFRVYL